MTAPAPPTLADRLSRPFERFFRIEAASAGVLFAMMLLALAWANSPWSESYQHFWHEEHIALSLLGWHFEMSLGHFVNDALMAIFFFVVGLEIKRELVHGELSTRRKAMLPVAGALGGMVVPALIYTSFHYGGPAVRGWGVPMATDIAFAVAVMSLLGNRVPRGLRVFLLALAIADDLGAVAVIAIFYTENLSLGNLALSVASLAVVYGMNRAGVRAFAAYWIVGGISWYFMVQSGVHATVAGVFLGFLTPTRPRNPSEESLLDRGQHLVRSMWDRVRTGDDAHGAMRHQAARQLQRVGMDAISPLDYLVNELDRWVAFLIMPVFALANAGVHLDASTLSNPETQGVAIAVALGLLVGKPIGITLFSLLAVRTGLAALPSGVNWPAIAATGLMAGIGFTVALFITSLAFIDSAHADGAKIGILSGSFLAAVLGLLVLNRALGSTGQDESSIDPEMSHH
jgi:NhaA family Na+:H+ antiporter